MIKEARSQSNRLGRHAKKREETTQFLYFKGAIKATFRWTIGTFTKDTVQIRRNTQEIKDNQSQKNLKEIQAKEDQFTRVIDGNCYKG